MTERQVRVLTVTLIVHLIVLRFTIRDLRRRPDAAVRGYEAVLAGGGEPEHDGLGRLLAAGSSPPPAARRPPHPLAHVWRLSSAPADLDGCRRTDRARRDRPRSTMPRCRIGSTKRGTGRPPRRAPVHAASLSPESSPLRRPGLVVTPSVSIRKRPRASTSVHATPSVVGDPARKEADRRGTKHVNSSSAPSAAKAAGKTLRAMPAASSASTRWMAVSCAWRRAHMASGDGAGQEGPALEVGRRCLEHGGQRGAPVA